MMKVKLLSPEEWGALKPKLIRFVHKHGENRITARSLQCFRRLQPADLAKRNGTQVGIAWENNKLAAASFFSNYGKDASILVASPASRGKGIGSRLLKLHLSSLKQIYCDVAEDNLACIKACIKAGLRPVQSRYGPAGKPTFQFSNERGALPCKNLH